MLKFRTVNADGKSSLWIGLSQRNLDRLPEDPIMFELSELGEGWTPDRVVIVAGPTEKDIGDRLRHMGLPVPDLRQPQPGERVRVEGDG